MSDSDKPPVPPTPATVELINYAVASGMTGRPVSVIAKDYNPLVVNQLWTIFAEILGTDRVVDLSRPDALKRIWSVPGSSQLILVPPGYKKAVTAIAWGLLRSDKKHTRRPAMLLDPSSQIDDPPAAMLTVVGSRREELDIIHWFDRSEQYVEAEAKRMKEADAQLDGFNFQPCGRIVAEWQIGSQATHIMHRQVLTGLLAGAMCLRAPTEIIDPFGVAIECYERIRQLLQCECVRSHDDVRDPLTVAMVHRANAYLSMKSKAGRGISPARANARRAGNIAPETCDASSAPRLITLPEIIDLGNKESRLVLELCESLRAGDPEGFQKIGVIDGALKSNTWAPDAIRLASLLMPWTLKQARNRFEYLRSAGIIAASRDARNKPWQYSLPSDFSASGSPFDTLPPPTALICLTEDGPNRDESPRLTVGCPQPRATRTGVLT